MTDKETATRQKQEAIDLLRKRLKGKEQTLRDIDQRLLMYFDDVAQNVSADPNDENDVHNIYEVLGAAKFLRMLDTYTFNRKKVQTVIRLREGEWLGEGKTWVHIGGGLKCPGTSGARYYRWQPFQVFVLASVFGFMSWVNTENEAGTKADLLPTEREKDGYIWDYRRVCTEFVYFGPRKTDKTGLAAYIQFIFFFFEDDNAETYCCANSSDQAKLLFNRTRQLIAQMDDGDRIRSTQTVIDWKQQYKSIRDTSVRPLSAGGKTKDGMFAQLCCADEFGSAPYTNGKSDMLSLVNVIQSSMGPRREPMTFITTTAGTISTGPFIEKLGAIHNVLLNELAIDKGEAVPDFESDRRLCLCLEPDEWECEESTILSKRSLRKKVNPMLGLIVQNASYDGWISEARNDQTKMPELIAKYFNHYQTGRVTTWIKAEQVRPLQREMRIDDCTKDKGWVIFGGLDFSQGNDLHTGSWLAARKHPSGRGTEFFADFDAWIKESTLNQSSIRPLYEQWIAQGWLHVSTGEIFQPSLFIQRLDELIKKGCQFMYFGYDKYQSKDPINTLKAYLQATWGIANPDPYIQVVSQLNSEFNAPTDDLFAAMFAPQPFISFSNNPMWPWCFGNAALEIDGRDNKRPVKRSQSDSCKVDPVQAIIMALDLYERYEGSQH
jgi:phage terminase large subunit-like protein